MVVTKDDKIKGFNSSPKDIMPVAAYYFKQNAITKKLVFGDMTYVHKICVIDGEICLYSPKYKWQPTDNFIKFINLSMN